MPQNSSTDSRTPGRHVREARKRHPESSGEAGQGLSRDEDAESGSGRARPETLADITDDVSEVAAAASEQLNEAASTLGDTAKEAASATLSAVSDQASALASNIAAEVSTVAETEKDRGADAILGFAKAIQRASSELDGQSPQIARAFRSAAGSVESFSDSLRGERISDLIASASDYARRQPLTFFAGALVAGFAASRFLLSHKPPAAAGAAGPVGVSDIRPER